MGPGEFVELLAKELQVGGVVVGSNYRFGYKAAGTAEMLKELAPKHGMKVAVVDLVERREDGLVGEPEVVSSSRVRAALAEGEMQVAALCLGRPYRLVADVPSSENGSDENCVREDLTVCSAAYNNESPAPGRYNVRVQVAASGWDICHVEAGQECEVTIDETRLTVVGPPLNVPVGPDRKLLLDFL